MTKVFLSIGHGGKDPGATAHGMKEKDINLVIGMKCKSELERHGITVICSRTKDENDPVAQEVIEANASGAELAFSIHTNSAANNKADGSESYYYSSNENGKRLAELCEKYTKELGQNSRGAKHGDKLYFIRKTNMTAVLSECAFINNDKDNDIIDTKAEQEKFGVAYAKAILEYFGIAYKSPTVVKSATTSSAYYGKYTGTSVSIDVVFKAIGVPEQYRGIYKKRRPVATKNGINHYTGTATQNLKLIALAKQGKLKKV